MPSPKPTPLSNLTIADLKTLLAEKEIETPKAGHAYSSITSAAALSNWFS